MKKAFITSVSQCFDDDAFAACDEVSYRKIILDAGLAEKIIQSFIVLSAVDQEVRVQTFFVCADGMGVMQFVDNGEKILKLKAHCALEIDVTAKVRHCWAKTYIMSDALFEVSVGTKFCFY